MSVLAVATRPTDGETEDRDLVAGVRAGDERAFELLYQRYQPRVGAYVRKMVRDDGRAEDITQEVFIAALRRMREDSEREILFKPWIFEIAKNKCIDAFRRARNASEVSFDARDAVGAEEHDRLAEPGATPDSAVEGKLAIDNLCGAFGGLSQVHHDILVLREFEGLSYRQIGDRLGMSRAAVESTLFRARKRLSQEYEELVSGARCLRVQRLVDEYGGRAPGLRDKRRMSRHLAHCQPCRRYAGRAGVDLGPAARPAGTAARIAAFLPLPAFLRRRWGDEDAAAAPLFGHGGSIGQWSANAATMLDPGVVSGWTKAVATAATVAVAGMGAGAAFNDRAALDGFRDAGARPGGLSIFGSGRDAAPAPAPAPARGSAAERSPAAPSQIDSAGGARGAAPAAPALRPSREPAATSRVPRAPAVTPQPGAERGSERPLDSSGPPPASDPAPDGRGESGVPRPAEAVERVVGTTGDAGGGPAASGTAATGAAGSAAPELLGGDPAPATPTVGAGDPVVPTTDAAAASDVPAVTVPGDTVSPKMTATAAITTTTSQSLGG